MKMTRVVSVFVVLASLAALPAVADQISYTRTATFSSDLNDDVILTFPTFNNQGGTLILSNVRVDLVHSAQVDLRADNDDPFKIAVVNGRMIRSWTLSGPNLFTAASETRMTDIVTLDVDNGDGDEFDPTPPDGTDFGSVAYNDVNAGSFGPDKSLYDTDGDGTVDMVADVVLMVNDLQFTQEPDRWQLEVQDPSLTVDVTVTYTFAPIPLPAGGVLALLGLGCVGYLRRKFA